MNDIKYLLETLYTYDLLQLSTIKSAMEDGLSIDKLKIIANPNLTSIEMDEVRIGFVKRLDIDQVLLYADPKFNHMQMQEIRKGFLSQMRYEDVNIYAKPEFNYMQMDEIRSGLQKKRTRENLHLFYDPEFTPLQMRAIRLSIYVEIIPIEYIKTYAKPECDFDTMMIKYHEWYDKHNRTLIVDIHDDF